MKRTFVTNTTRAMATAALILSLAGCGANASTSASTAKTNSKAVVATEQTVTATEEQVSTTAEQTSQSLQGTGEGTSDVYTDRDLQQVADTSNAKSITVTSGQDVEITEEGVYVLSGNATNATICVNVDNTQKVQLVLNNLSIENNSAPAIYVLSADKVFVTTTEGSTNSLSVTGTFVADGETNLDGAIFSKDDLVLNGMGSLNISSTKHGVVSNDDLKITGGTYVVTCWGDALKANDELYVYDGTFDLTAESDGVQSDVLVQVDGGSLSIRAAEGIESTTVRIAGGNLNISATDDGINATAKSEDGTTPSIEISGGDTTITMGEGDTDALDVNGNLLISGGTVNITAQFAFDFDQTGELTGGTVYVNGEQVTTITNSMMGGMGGGRPMDGGRMGGDGGPMMR